jgi:peptidoglycan hydrolase-like protein with peptidoglycan-binding domain
MGSVDGKNGPRTRAAISQFQKRKGLPQTASLDQQTLDDLSGGGSTTHSNSGSSMNSNSTSTPSASPGNATTQGGAGAGNSMQPGFKQPTNNGAHTR